MTRTHGTKDFWLTALHRDARAFRTAVGTPGLLAEPVPSCPGWTVEDLVLHLGQAYARIAAHATSGTTSRVPRDVEPGPGGEAALGWFDERYAEVADAMGQLDPQAPAWNWGPQPKTAIFWHRRLAHETAIHRWDAQMAVGHAEPVDPALATDGVTEVLDTWLPGGVRKGPTDRSGVVQLVATEPPTEWYVRLRADGGIALLDMDTLLDTDDPHARALAEGTASDLLLALYGRVGFETLDISGDPTLLESLRTG